MTRESRAREYKCVHERERERGGGEGRAREGDLGGGGGLMKERTRKRREGLSGKTENYEKREGKGEG